jgi:hypothetical protein
MPSERRSGCVAGAGEVGSEGVPQLADGKARLREVRIVVASDDNSKTVAGVDCLLIQRGWV